MAAVDSLASWNSSKPRKWRRKFSLAMVLTSVFVILAVPSARAQEIKFSPFEEYFKAATCDRGVPRAAGWNTGTFHAATLGCLVGKSGVVIDFLNFPGNTRSSANTLEMLIPDHFQGSLTARFDWFASGTNGTVRWFVNAICLPGRGARNPVLVHGKTLTTAAPAKPNIRQITEITDINLRECSSGDMLSIELVRDDTDSVNRLKSSVRVMGMSVNLP